jgi:hypothetical protein
MHKEWRGLKTPGDRLIWAREGAGYEHSADAAAALGMEGSAASTYFGHENGSRGLARAGSRYAEFFRVSYDWLMNGKGAPKALRPPTDNQKLETRRAAKKHAEAEGVQIIGRAGGGPEGSIEFPNSEQPLGWAPMPPGWTETTVALEVWGNSMRPIANDGWLVYYDSRKGGLSQDMFGQPCVIGLVSGHTVLKTPFPGSKRGLFNLESQNPAIDTMRDQRVKWAALVTAIVPRKAARNLRKDVRGEASS